MSSWFKKKRQQPLSTPAPINVPPPPVPDVVVASSTPSIPRGETFVLLHDLTFTDDNIPIINEKTGSIYSGVVPKDGHRRRRPCKSIVASLSRSPSLPTWVTTYLREEGVPNNVCENKSQAIQILNAINDEEVR
jgi:hypothetical protein